MQVSKTTIASASSVGPAGPIVRPPTALVTQYLPGIYYAPKLRRGLLRILVGLLIGVGFSCEGSVRFFDVGHGSISRHAQNLVGIVVGLE